MTLNRRRLLASGLAAGTLWALPAFGQVTDLEGYDPLWRDVESAIDAFFPFADFRSEGIHVDLPQHADVGSSVPLTLRIDSAMTESDYPLVVHILADGNPTPHVMSAWFTPMGGRAEFSTRIRLESSQTVTAVAHMRDGRHLRVDRPISVSFGACGQIGEGGNAEILAFQPETRVSVPETAVRGDIEPLRALISHPMETGMRRSATQDWIRQRIVSRFGVQFDGTEFFRARLYPALATNPYFLIYARMERSGRFDFSWFDMTNQTFTASAEIGVQEV